MYFVRMRWLCHTAGGADPVILGSSATGHPSTESSQCHLISCPTIGSKDSRSPAWWISSFPGKLPSCLGPVYVLGLQAWSHIPGQLDTCLSRSWHTWSCFHSLKCLIIQTIRVFGFLGVIFLSSMGRGNVYVSFAIPSILDGWIHV